MGVAQFGKRISPGKEVPQGPSNRRVGLICGRPRREHSLAERNEGKPVPVEPSHGPVVTSQTTLPDDNGVSICERCPRPGNAGKADRACAVHGLQGLA